jgi:ABC-type Na+ efflux pump permease subunit
VTPDETDPGRRGRGKGPWIAALLVVLALIVAAGVVTAVMTGDDDGEDLTEQVQGAADDGLDAATSAGDDALDAVTGDAPDAAESGAEAATSAAGDAFDTVTDQAGEAVDAVTGDSGDGSGTAPQAVQDDPVVERLAQGRELPFVAGPWERRQYRERVWDSLSEATRARAERVDQDGAFGIRIQ